MIVKILYKNEKFTNRHRCGLNFDQFKSLFEKSNICMTKEAEALFEKCEQFRDSKEH